MTNPSVAAAPLPSNQVIDLSQTKAAEAETKGVATSDRLFHLGRKSWPLVASVSFVRAANIQKALVEFDLLALADELPSIVEPDHREDLTAYLMADTESSDADHITMLDVVDAWGTAQEVLAARPLSKSSS